MCVLEKERWSSSFKTKILKVFLYSFSLSIWTLRYIGSGVIQKKRKSLSLLNDSIFTRVIGELFRIIRNFVSVLNILFSFPVTHWRKESLLCTYTLLVFFPFRFLLFLVIFMKRENKISYCVKRRSHIVISSTHTALHVQPGTRFYDDYRVMKYMGVPQ